ncbi:hypothetical protein [Jiella sp. M17.18]|uniref:hypothetical protein n=1 Tax=Jiella sp. M17.18 TaxID=3234247 RepID=UPI0034DFE84A
MPLQNRVTPEGDIVADPARGTLTGNRGVLHRVDRTLGDSRWRHKAWIACRLEFKNRHRVVMTPGRWTELFFLDEAVALAAGHRPCAECRRAEYLAFKAAFAAAHGEAVAASAKAIDDRLHACRVDSRTRRQIRYEAAAESLPDGTFVLSDGTPHLVRQGQLLRWRMTGYDVAKPILGGMVTVLTPSATIATLAAGYPADVHDSAAAALAAV